MADITKFAVALIITMLNF